MKYRAEIQKFVTSQYIYAGVRMALAIVVPSVILAYFGLLKEYFLFPLATSFVGLTDLPGPYIRRRNAFILAVISFSIVAATTSLLKDYPLLIFLEIICFGIFFSMIGVFGLRLASVGGITLVVLSIFIDGSLAGSDFWKSLLVFTAGSIWFLFVFIVMVKIQPYKLAGQMIGENYIELADYLKIKAKFYLEKPNINALNREIIAKQIVIKNLQEETRELVFKTRTMVNEATTTSRLLMLMFLNSIDLYEKLFTSEQNYNKIHETFENEKILKEIHQYLIILSNEIENIGINLQSGTKSKSLHNISEAHQKVYDEYFNLRRRAMSADTLESFMALRMVLVRINDITDDIKTIYQVYYQDIKNAKSLSTGLDLEKFVPKQERLNTKVLLNNFSLKSSHFRHAIRITTALLLGYAFSLLDFIGIGHSYWILITIVAIMRPAFSTTKHRNLLRLYGTIAGAVVAYILLTFIHNESLLLGLLFGSMTLCFTLLRGKYAWAVFFMTIYIFIAFNFLNPGNINTIFLDRILDTAIAGVIVFAVSYFVFPVWEHSQNIDLMKVTSQNNLNYFKAVMSKLEEKNNEIEHYKLQRKNAIISLANLSDNFQRMLSDPKNQQRKMELVHQFVNTSHLITAYTASLSQYAKIDNLYSEIDWKNWDKKISTELLKINLLLNNKSIDNEIKNIAQITPKDSVEDLLTIRKNEIAENEFLDNRNPKHITYLTELKNIQEILILLYDVAKEQRKILENFLNQKD